MRIWVSRAQPEAAATAERLRRRGHEPFVAPVLEIRPVRAQPDMTRVAAMAFTSRNGPRHFPVTPEALALPVFAVGDTTAETARSVGFSDVRSAGGDGAALAKTIAAQLDPGAGAVMVGRAQETAFDLEGALGEAGFEARSAIVYESRYVSPDAELRQALAADPPLEAVLVHSRRAAVHVAWLLRAKAGRERLIACSISRSAGEPLVGLGLKDVLAAQFPNEASLLKLLPEAPSEPPEGS